MCPDKRSATSSIKVVLNRSRRVGRCLKTPRRVMTRPPKDRRHLSCLARASPGDKNQCVPRLLLKLRSHGQDARPPCTICSGPAASLCIAPGSAVNLRGSRSELPGTKALRVSSGFRRMRRCCNRVKPAGEKNWRSRRETHRFQQNQCVRTVSVLHVRDCSVAAADRVASGYAAQPAAGISPTFNDVTVNLRPADLERKLAGQVW